VANDSIRMPGTSRGLILQTFACLSVCAGTATAQNLLVNPGFEDGLAGWAQSVGTAVYEIDTDTHVGGQAAVRGFDPDRGSLGRLAQDVTSSVAYGEEYVLSGWLRSEDVTGGGGLAFGVQYVDADGGGVNGPPFVPSIGFVLGTTDWMFFETAPFVIAAPPAGAAGVTVSIDFSDAAGTGWVDDLSLRRLEDYEQEARCFSAFPDFGAFVLNGATSDIHAVGSPVLYDGHPVLRLVDSVSQAGQAFLASPVRLADNDSFNTSFTFQLHDSEGGLSDQDGPGADGFAFVLASTPLAIGGPAAGLGYSFITPCLAVEFDTWDNGDLDGNDGNHVAIAINGDFVNAVAQAPVPQRLNDGDVWHAWIDYDGLTSTLEVRLSQLPERPSTPTLTHTIDIRAILGADYVFPGFTAGTGAASNDHDIRNWCISTDECDSYEVAIPSDFSTTQGTNGLRYEVYSDNRPTNVSNPGDGSVVEMEYKGVETFPPGCLTMQQTGPLYGNPSDLFPYIFFERDRNALLLHNGTFSTASLGAAVSYTAPSTGRYRARGVFARANTCVPAGDGVDATILVNTNAGSPVFTAHLPADIPVDANDYFGGEGARPFDVVVDLQAGDALRFAVFSGPQAADGTFDLSALRFEVFSDCDENGQSDTCQIAFDPSLDQNGDGLLDGCAVLPNLVENGTFESPAIADNSFMVIPAQSSLLPGWEVSEVSVDVVAGPASFPAYDGNQSVDLAGTPGPGRISQTIPTVAGRTYRLSYALSANGVGPEDREVVVGFGESTVRRRGGALGEWVQFEEFFVATADTTVISFESELTSDRGGIVDGVRLTETEPVVRPDLAVQDVMGPQQAVGGTSFELAWTGGNTGESSAFGPWIDRVYISTDDVLDRDGSGAILDPVLGSAIFPEATELPPGGSYDRATIVQAPSQAGTYWLFLVLDADMNVAESGPDSNNEAILSMPVQVLAEPLADLEVAIIEAGSNPVSGEPVSVTYSVTNVGTGTTAPGSWLDAVFVSFEAEVFWPGTGDQPRNFYCNLPAPLIQIENGRALAPGEAYQNTAVVTLPEDFSGSIYVHVQPALHGVPCVSGVAVAEASIDNNTASAEIQVELNTAQPDLIPSAISPLPMTLSSGEEIAVTWTDQNIGTLATDSGNWVDAVYLAPPGTTGPIGASDILLGTLQRSGSPLGAGQSEPSRMLTARVPVELSGEFIIRVFTDSENVITEAFAEGNNIGSSAASINVIQGPQPDLFPVSLTGPSTTIPGHAIDVMWTAQNGPTGAGAPPPYALSWRDGIYLSEDNVFDPSDTLLDSFTVNTVQDGEGNPQINPYTRSRTLRLPNDATPGQKHLILVVDVENDVFELDAEGNNWRVEATASISIEDRPTDLVAASVSGTPTSGAPGQPVTLAWSVTNQGVGRTPVSSWQDSVFLSTDSTLDSDDPRLVAASRSGALDPSQSYTTESSVNLPVVPPGEYFLLIEADSGDQVFEAGAGEDNNVTAVPFTLSNDGADLRVTACAVPSAAQAGQPVTIEWTVANEGGLSTNATSWRDDIYLSSDAIIGSGDTLLGSRTITQLGGLAVGASYTQSMTITLPIDRSGELFIIKRTDAEKQVFETNEANNDLASAMSIDVDPAELANLIVASPISFDSTAVSGQALDVSWTVENTGVGATNAEEWRDGVFLSRDQFFDPDQDLFLGRRTRSGVLPPGGSYSAADVPLSIPFGAEGPYFVIVATDRGDRVRESNELDNARASSTVVIVDLPPPSDLVVTSVTPPPDSLLGADVEFSWEVMNAGTEPIVGDWQHSLYLSTDPVWDIDDTRVDRLEITSPEPTAPLLPGETRMYTGIGRVPPVLPGAYYVLARTDIFNAIPETNEGNNLGPSGSTFETSAIPLALGTPDHPMPFEGEIGPGEELYFQLLVSDGETIRIDIMHTDQNAQVNMFVRFGDVPKAGNFDAAGNDTVIGPTLAGRYFIKISSFADIQTSASDHFVLNATMLPLSVSDITPSEVGDGIATVSVFGAQFSNDTMFLLTSSKGEVPILDVRIASAHQAIITADYSQHARLPIDCTATDENESARLNAALQVVTAGPRLVQIEVLDGPPLRAGVTHNISIKIRSLSNTDIDYSDGIVTVATNEGEAIRQVTANTPFMSLQSGPDWDAVQFIFRRLSPYESQLVTLAVQPGNIQNRMEIGGFTSSAWFTRAENLAVFEHVGDQIRERVQSDQSHFDPGFASEALLHVSDDEAWNHFWETIIKSSPLLQPLPPENYREHTQLTAGVDLTQQVLREASIDEHPDPDEARDGADCECPGWIECEFICAAPPAGLTRPGPLVFALGAPPEWVCNLHCKARSVFCTVAAALGGDKCWFRDRRNGVDPNEKAAPGGSGADRWIARDSTPVLYRIDFENLPEATAPAALVTIRDELDPNLDPTTVRLGDIRFGDISIDVPDNRIAYQERLDLTATLGVLVDVTGGVDAANGEVFWILRAIDPATGELPTSAFLGFLPPEDGTGRGQGYVEFTVLPRAETPSGAVIRNDAEIVFDFNEPIITNEVFNTIDADDPTSMMASLPVEMPTTAIPLAWAGDDPQPGSGLAGFTVYASESGGPFTPVVGFSQGFGSLYEGRGGATYEFYSVARDNAGNIEEAPEAPDAITMVALQAPGELAVSNTTSTTFVLGALASTNADFIEHAVFEETTGQWLGADGQLQSSPLWLPLDQWQSMRVRSLLPSTAYAFRTLARLGDGMPEVPGSVVQIVTTREGDVTGDDFVDCEDLDAVRAALGGIYPNSTFDARADVSWDSRVTFRDLGIVRRALQDDCSEDDTGGPGPKEQIIPGEQVELAELRGQIIARGDSAGGVRTPGNPSEEDDTEREPEVDERAKHLELVRELMDQTTDRLVLYMPEGDERALGPMAEVGVPTEALVPLALPDWWEVDLRAMDGGAALLDLLRPRLIDAGVFVSSVIEREQANVFIGPHVILGVEPGWLISENSLNEAIGEKAELDESFRAGRSVARVLNVGASGDDVLRGAEGLLSMPGIESSEPGLVFSFNEGERALEAVHLDDLMARLAAWPRSAGDVATARAALETTLPMPALRDTMSRSAPVDLTGDGVVDAQDLTILINRWEQPGSIFEGDITGDGYVDEADFRVLVEAFSTGAAEAASDCGCTGTRR